MSYLYVKTELSSKIFEHDIINNQFEEMFKRNETKISEKFEYYLNAIKQKFVYKEENVVKEVTLAKVKALTKNYIITEAIRDVFEKNGNGVIFEKVCTMLLIDEEKILNYILGEAIYKALKEVIKCIQAKVDSSLDISYFTHTSKK